MTPNTALLIANLWNVNAVKSYVNDRTQEIYKRLAICSPEDLPRYQGALTELKIFEELHERAKSVLESENGKKSYPKDS